MNVYLVMYSTEISIGLALLMGLALGFFIGSEWAIDRFTPKRDAKGRFTK